MLINVALFILGLSIGLLACSIYTRWQDKQFMDLMASNHDFLERYAKLTRQGYDNLNQYVNDQMTLLNETVHKLLGISQQMSNDSNENRQKILELFRQDHNNKGQLITNLTNFVKEHEKINEERWSLIVDYITNDGPERAEENLATNGMCNTCKNQKAERCYGTLRDDGVYLCNYEPKSTAHEMEGTDDDLEIFTHR